MILISNKKDSNINRVTNQPTDKNHGRPPTNERHEVGVFDF